MSGPHSTSTPRAPGVRPYGIAPPAYRLPDATRLGRVRLQVGDLSRSIAFYERVLGLQATRPDPDAGALLAAEDGRVLVELRERPGAPPAPPRGRLGLYHLAILVPDRAALGRLATHLATVGARIGSADHLVSEALYLRDPDGLGIEVYSDRPRETWQHARRELRMTTEPLDVADLVRAGGGESWRAMPAGTVIGHVHLHVGDLATAEAFYHAALGLDKIVWSYPGALFLSAGGYHHHLGTNRWAAGAAPAGPGEARLLEWELVVPDTADVARAAASIAGAGYEVTPDRADWTSADPWGTVVRVRADASR